VQRGILESVIDPVNCGIPNANRGIKTSGQWQHTLVVKSEEREATSISTNLFCLVLVDKQALEVKRLRPFQGVIDNYLSTYR